MFDRIFRRAERKIDSVVSKYVRRAIVAVPLLIAAVFATAAISVKVVELYGPVNGYAMMAGAFAAIAGLIALFALTGDATPVEQAEAASAKDPEQVKRDDDSPLVPPELLSIIMAAAPVALPGVARTAARNLPMLVALAVVGYLMARYANSSGTGGVTAEGDAPATGGPDAEAAAAAAASDARVSEATATMAARAAAA
ncbi:MAG: hypothetical protein Q7T86_00305 [Hyphomicrobiaceae bacterium]|nr:hypothetical protein [Hyphomicrobiaceae bacterium]